MKISYERQEIIDEILEDIDLYGKNHIAYVFRDEYSIITDYDIECTKEDENDNPYETTLINALADFIYEDSILETTRGGALIKAYRLSKKMTQTQVAEQMQITYQVYQNWENGKKVPNFENVIKLANVFGFKLQEYADFWNSVKK